ncbi:hypothetical protein J3Q64DRAFT_1750562 [Phycomyces blakesleeanus]|uniref:Yeast cell wall synthesis Kre9/Knh1-like N-terminal domain-containing protein n=1 Tax=Phycomyces blakesleeanus TaxID=4837 RepID=A0ABR3AYK3_PHYBL
MKFISALIALAVAAVSADNIISVTSPLTGTVYTAGKSAIITWVNPTVPTISQIVFSQGLSTALQPVAIIANNVETASGTYTWAIPADTPAGTDYAFVFGTSPNQSYTGQFTIKAASGDAAAAAPAASSAASPVGASSSGSKAPAAASSSAGTKAAASSAAAPAASGTSGSTKNVAAVGTIALVGAAVAALL